MAGAVTTAALIAALKGERSLEDLAREVDVPLRTMQRWATTDDPESGPQWRYTSKLLALAGWLNTDAAELASVPKRTSPGDPLEALRGAVDATLAVAERIDERLTLVEQRLGQAGAPPVPAAPGKTRRGTAAA